MKNLLTFGLFILLITDSTFPIKTNVTELAKTVKIKWKLGDLCENLSEEQCKISKMNRFLSAQYLKITNNVTQEEEEIEVDFENLEMPIIESTEKPAAYIPEKIPVKRVERDPYDENKTKITPEDFNTETNIDDKILIVEESEHYDLPVPLPSFRKQDTSVEANGENVTGSENNFSIISESPSFRSTEESPSSKSTEDSLYTNAASTFASEGVDEDLLPLTENTDEHTELISTSEKIISISDEPSDQGENTMIYVGLEETSISEVASTIREDSASDSTPKLDRVLKSKVEGGSSISVGIALLCIGLLIFIVGILVLCLKTKLGRPSEDDDDDGGQVKLRTSRLFSFA